MVKMRKVYVYVEGGGQRESLRKACRRGFSKFLDKAGFEGRMPKVVACGSRNDAFDSFVTAIGQGKSAVLLVDSEDRLRDDSPAKHLSLRDQWALADDLDEQVHLMVQCMENWFLADKEALAEFFGQGFQSSGLPANPNVEEISKTDVIAGLRQATRAAKNKGQYSKGAHSFAILALIDPAKVKAAAPYAMRLFLYLHQALGADE
ncbi:MAG: DUF4276 family protein [Enhygromyxa sp.]